MASTAQMQAKAKAKAAKQVRSVGFNETEFNRMLMEVAVTITTHYPEQDYTSNTSTLSDTALAIIKHQPALSKKQHLKQMISFRDRFDKGVTLKHPNYKPTTGVSSFLIDHEKVLSDAGVPKLVRVMAGLLDTLIGEIHLRCV